MDENLQGLFDLAGVNAAVVFDGGGKLCAQRGKAVYDRALCEQVAGLMARAVDSIALQDEGWETATAHFADGTILLRRVGAVGGAAWVLGVVADAALNPAFAAVALRVAANKVKRALETSLGLAPSASAVGLGGSGVAPQPEGAAASSALGAPPRPSGSQILGAPAPAAGGSRPVLANTGLSWSKVSGSGMTNVAAADPASAAFLQRCSKALALGVGPMARFYVEEAVRRLCPDAPFAMPQARALCEELANQIEDAEDRAAFLAATKS